MVVADTSIWVDHLRTGNSALKALLENHQILCHPFIIGEIALGHLRQRKAIIDAMQNMPQAIVASDEDVMTFVEKHHLYGQGIGWIDAHLLAAARLSSARLWSRDKNLIRAAEQFGVAY